MKRGDVVDRAILEGLTSGELLLKVKGFLREEINAGEVDWREIKKLEDDDLIDILLGEYDWELEDEDDEDDDSIGGWEKFLPELMKAIDGGTLDKHLTAIALACRNRFMELNPDFASTQPSAGGSSRKVNREAILGMHGEVIPVAAYNVGLSGRIPVGTFRAGADGVIHAYRKDDLIHRTVRIANTVRYRGGTTLEPGTIVRVVDTAMKQFMVQIVTDHNGSAPIGREAATRYPLKYDFNLYLFEGFNEGSGR